ncbi:hypothetical protein [Actinophytocola sp.]|uniref:hypothetical protein n=1 Tax=Actinophytocola sp. TaxID=1872138 RepID=UPI002D7F4B4A|nr:hypothetical protein [Actinophytocola sp.]HET9139708.1 hypothetical protein [Actinophytocola sp.]
MARHQRPVPAGALGQFASGLRGVRRRAGNPSLRALAGETGYPVSDLAAMLTGDQVPSLTVTLAFVTACGGDVGAWADRWAALSGTALPGPPAGPAFVSRRRRRTRLALVLTGATVVPVVVAAVLLVAAARPRPPQVLAATPAASTSGTAAQRADVAPVYRDIAGPACPMDETRRTNVAGAPGAAGWRENRGGSWTGDQCDDRFLYTELRYDPAADNPENYFQWLFTLAEPTAQLCQVEVFVPNSGRANAVVWYEMADRFDNFDVAIGRFAVDQASNQGTWVPGGTVPVDTGVLLVQIGGDGEDLQPGKQSIAAGPIRISCVRP